jgi:predicted ATP-binding protein involved in virulence
VGFLPQPTRHNPIINGIVLEAISGIVLIDEVDKHLHIKLQKEILPALFTLFPNVQFIVSSHSPFLSMGLAEVALDRTKIIDLETFGISKDLTKNELYVEVYQTMIGENDRFKELYRSREKKTKTGSVPLIITEGKTDVRHLRAAKKDWISGTLTLNSSIFLGIGMMQEL